MSPLPPTSHLPPPALPSESFTTTTEPVTDAILGEGAGDLADCFTNAVYGGPDNFSPAGNIVHSLVVINGVCAATSAQLPDVQYRLGARAGAHYWAGVVAGEPERDDAETRLQPRPILPDFP